MIRKIVVCSMAAVMTAASLVGCGGGGDGVSSAVIIAADLSNQPISQVHTTAKASNIKNTFKIENNPTANYEATISANVLSENGFKYGTDKIQYPLGDTRPSALFSEVNNTIDGKVDLTWTDNSRIAVIHLVDLDAVSEAGLQSSAADAVATIYETY